MKSLGLTQTSLFAILTILLVGCNNGPPSVLKNGTPRQQSKVGFELVFEILSGSENEALEPLLKEFGEQNRRKIHMTYRGSVDIMLEMDRGREMTCDAVWPANSLWI
jgi:ABC-type molybdate transport system substrate-binding protein